MTHSTLFKLFLLLSIAAPCVGLARRFRIPSLLAYLAVGILLGPHGLRLLAEDQDLSAIAEFGVVFLMFSIGLEFSLPKLHAMRHLVFGLGAAQMGLTALGTALVTAIGYGHDWRAGLAVGLAVAMSSTAIVAKMLSERFELHSRSGQQTMGVLLFQDLAVVPCLVLLPALTQPASGLATALGMALLQAIAVLSVLIWLGQRWMHRLFDTVAQVRSSEFFVLMILWVLVGLAYATGQAGLSLALGAFVGGMLLSETPYRHQVEADIRPFRDILLGFFFITVGMMLDVGFVLANAGLLLLAVLLLVLGKGVVMLVITLLAHTPLVVAYRTAAQLAQSGEFGLVLVGLAYRLHLIPEAAFQLTLSAMLLSMFLAPALIAQAARLSGELNKGRWAHQPEVLDAIRQHPEPLSRHVLLCGYGRTGQAVARFLTAEQIPWLALDLDPRLARQASPTGGKVAFGNAERQEVLIAAGLAHARAVVIACPQVTSAEHILRQIRRQEPELPVIVRATDEHAAERLRQAGASEAIPEIQEGSLMLALETLVRLDVPVERAMQRIRGIRASRYASLREFYAQKNGDAPEL